MFGISQIKADLEALTSKVEQDVAADITTLGAKVKSLEAKVEAFVAALEARVKTLETPSAAPVAPKA